MTESLAVAFKNLEPSQFIRDAINERLLPHIMKFPDLKATKIRVTVEMENSPTQAGPDEFSIRLQILSGKFRGFVISKKRETFYLALADVADVLLDKLNNHGDRTRVVQIRTARKLKTGSVG